jgi:hypothetical protein
MAFGAYGRAVCLPQRHSLLRVAAQIAPLEPSNPPLPQIRFANRTFGHPGSPCTFAGNTRLLRHTELTRHLQQKTYTFRTFNELVARTAAAYGEPKPLSALRSRGNGKMGSPRPRLPHASHLICSSSHAPAASQAVHYVLRNGPETCCSWPGGVGTMPQEAGR